MTYEELVNKRSELILFESIRGSHLFGLETPESDEDRYGIFIGPQEWMYGSRRRYQRMISDEKNDRVFMELEKWIVELGKSNPDALMSLFTPPSLIIRRSSYLDPLFSMAPSLLTKECFKSFRGYARSQIGKAKGLNKAMNIDPAEVIRRKTPLEFCWVHKEGTEGVWSLEKWLRENGLRQEHCGICRLPNGVEFYVLFYDWWADKELKLGDYARLRYGRTADRGIEEEWLENKKSETILYRGILDPLCPDTTQLRLSSIPKSLAHEPLICFQYNSDAFSSHCRQYREYHEWVKNRNPKRYEQNLGKNYDSKNLSHTVRIMRMAKEIAEGKGMILNRQEAGDRDLLLGLKHHKFSYDEAMEIVKKSEEEMISAFERSSLPDSPDQELLEDILIDIRKKCY